MYLDKLKKVMQQSVIRKIYIPNASLNVGLFNEHMASMPQTPFINGLTLKKPALNNDIDSSNNLESGKGTVYIPFTKDYYMGEVL